MPVTMPFPVGSKPVFRVAGDAPCTFVGNITVLGWRMPPGPYEDIQQMVIERCPPEGSMVTLLPDEGSLVSSMIGLNLLDDVIEGDLSGHSWWLDGQQVDAGRCGMVPAQF